jgi:alkyldihydroxyacetonephosphate synthase
VSADGGEIGIRRDTAFDAWGEPGAEPVLGEAVRAMLAQRLGELVPTARVDVNDVRLPAPSELPESLIAAAGGEARISTGPVDRIRHSAGKSYPDLIKMRAGALAAAPDAVVAPADADLEGIDAGAVIRLGP